MKLIPIMNEDELTKFYLDNCMQDFFLKYLYEECNIKLVSYYESGSNIDFGKFIECRGNFNAYVFCKYDVTLSQVNLTKYFCNLNKFDLHAFFGSCD